jgi:xanthine/uracil permease
MLNVGVVGLLLYLTPFVIVIHRMLSAIRRDDSGKMSQGSRFAVSMVAMNMACLFAIFTTSTFGIVSMLMTLLVALPAAWLAMPTQERDSTPQPTGDKDVRKGLPARYGPIRSGTT